MEQILNLIELQRQNPDTGEIDIRYATFPERWMSLYNDDYRDYFRRDYENILCERNDEINDRLGDEYDTGWTLQRIDMFEYIEATQGDPVKLYSFR